MTFRPEILVLGVEIAIAIGLGFGIRHFFPKINLGCGILMGAAIIFVISLLIAILDVRAMKHPPSAHSFNGATNSN